MSPKRTPNQELRALIQRADEASQEELSSQLEGLQESAPALHAAIVTSSLQLALQLGLWIDPPPAPTPIDPWALPDDPLPARPRPSSIRRPMIASPSPSGIKLMAASFGAARSVFLSRLSCSLLQRILDKLYINRHLDTILGGGIPDEDPAGIDC